jgi:hypothetical protein
MAAAFNPISVPGVAVTDVVSASGWPLTLGTRALLSHVREGGHRFRREPEAS